VLFQNVLSQRHLLQRQARYLFMLEFSHWYRRIRNQATAKRAPFP
jgi:hypothetical protein